MSSSSKEISLEDICSLCTSLGRPMLSLMDRNAVALVVSTGEIAFTKLGTKVLSETHLNHPIERLIMNACNKYHARTGEDIKEFLILLTELMHGVKGMLKKYDEAQLRRTLSLELASLVSFAPSLFGSIQSTSTIVSNPCGSFELFFKDLNGIIQTFINNRFSPLISKDLSELINGFVLDSIPHWNNAGDALQYLISHFDIFCSKALLPLHKSSILKGFLLYQRFSYPALKETTSLRFVVIWDVMQKSEESVTWSSGSLHLSPAFWKNVEGCLTTLRDEGVSVILTTSLSCENFISLCSQCAITLINKIPPEEIMNILFFTAISPLSSLSETLEPRNIGCIQNLSILSFSTSLYVHLEVSGTRNCIVPNHIVLCALNDGLWKEYFDGFYDCLKVVKKWLESSVHFQPKHQAKYPNSDKIMTLNVEYPSGESLRRPGLHLESSDDSTSKSCNLGLSFPLGLWESSLLVSLTSASFPRHLFPNLFNILESALLQLVCLVWSIPVRNYDGPKSYSDFYKRVKGGKDCDPIVPVRSKEDQFIEVLELIKQLLKIDAIVGSK